MRQRTQETDLAWFAGIIDGDGSLTSSRNYKDGKQTSICFILRIEVTTPTMITRIIEILKTHGIEYKLYGPLRKKWSTRNLWRLDVFRKASMHKLCSLVMPYLVVKQAEFELAFQFLEKSVKVRTYKQTDEDLKILDKIRVLRSVESTNRVA